MKPIPSGQSPVSVIIPIYNGQEYIAETVRSVLNQTYRNLEVLCIIDGTKDDSFAILSRIDDPRLQVLEQENRGATATRNRGLTLAKGEYVLFLDQDDTIRPEFIEAAVKEMIRTDSTAVAVNGQLIDAQGGVIRRMYRFNKPRLTLKRLLRGNQLFTTSQVLMRRAPLAKLGGFDSQAGIADDWEMWIRQLRHGKLVFLDRKLMSYRQHGSNQSLNVEKMLRCELKIVDEKLTGLGKPERIKSYSYMRHSRRAGDFKTLAEALKLNSSLMLEPRFYLTACQIAWARRKS